MFPLLSDVNGLVEIQVWPEKPGRNTPPEMSMNAKGPSYDQQRVNDSKESRIPCACVGSMTHDQTRARFLSARACAQSWRTLPRIFSARGGDGV